MAKNFVHTEVMELEASPGRVREFILTPERILDYFPQPVEGGVLEPGNAIFCRGEMATSLLEKLEDESSDSMIVLKVSTAFGLEPPYTRARIEEATSFTMIEDWAIAVRGTGTTLTKTWRDVEMAGQDPAPMIEAVREGAKAETEALISGWNRAASSD